jgi:hypothetical protein
MTNEISGMGKSNGNVSLICKQTMFDEECSMKNMKANYNNLNTFAINISLKHGVFDQTNYSINFLKDWSSTEALISRFIFSVQINIIHNA